MSAGQHLDRLGELGNHCFLMRVLISLGILPREVGVRRRAEKPARIRASVVEESRVAAFKAVRPGRQFALSWMGEACSSSRIRPDARIYVRHKLLFPEGREAVVLQYLRHAGRDLDSATKPAFLAESTGQWAGIRNQMPRLGSCYDHSS